MDWLHDVVILRAEIMFTSNAIRCTGAYAQFDRVPEYLRPQMYDMIFDDDDNLVAWDKYY